MTGLQQFWHKLTSLQKISLISLALVLLALPVGLYLTGQSQEIRKKAAEEAQIPQLPSSIELQGSRGDSPLSSSSGQASIASTGLGPSVQLEGQEKGYINQELNYTAAIKGENIDLVVMRWRKADADPSKAASWTFVAEKDGPMYNCDSSFWTNLGYKVAPYFQCGRCQSDTQCPLLGKFITSEPGNYYIHVYAGDLLMGRCGATVYSVEPKCQPKGEINFTITQKPSPPTASLTGPTSSKTGEAMAFSAKAQEEQLQWARIHWAKATSDLTQGSSWTMVAENTRCGEASECSVSGNFTPIEAGEYWLAVTANNPGGPCTGNPKWDSVPGWSDCGQNSRIKVSVSQSKEEATQTLNLSPGYNLIGLTIGKEGYKAADFIKDLNSSFTGGSGKIIYLFHYNADGKAWETYTTTGKGTTANFPVSPWEAYWVYTKAAGTAKISGGGVALPDSVRIPAGWSLWSTPTTLTDIPDAKTLLAKAKEQGVDLLSIWKWDAGAKQYVGHRQGQSENNFSLVPGEGYWIYNGGSAKDFSLNFIPPPPVPGN